MEFAVATVSVMILGIFDFAYIKRKELITESKKINIKELAPKGWKQLTCYISIISTLFVCSYMLAVFYDMSTVYTIKRVSLVAIMLLIAICDFQEYRIPNKLILVGLMFRIVFLCIEVITELANVFATILNEGIAVAGVAVICVLCMLLAKGSLGMGDVKLMMLMAAFLGVEGICYAMIFSMFFAFVCAVILLITKKKSRNDAIPFAPFILAGTVTSMILTGV